MSYLQFKERVLSKRIGDGIAIQISKGKFAIVDAEDSARATDEANQKIWGAFAFKNLKGAENVSI